MGSEEYRAIEIIMEEPYTSKADLYSMGLVIFKILNPSGESAAKARNTLDGDHLISSDLL